MSVPYLFSNIPGGTNIPLANLDANFSYLTASPSFSGNVTINGTLSLPNWTIYSQGSGNKLYIQGSALASPTFVLDQAGNGGFPNGALYLGDPTVNSGVLTLYSGTNNTAVFIKSGANTSNWNFTFPTGPGTANQVLATDGNGSTSWVTNETSPSAPTNSVQFNNAGVFGGSSNLTWNNGTSVLSIIGTQTLTSSASPVLTLNTTGTNNTSIEIQNDGINKWSFYNDNATNRLLIQPAALTEPTFALDQAGNVGVAVGIYLGGASGSTLPFTPQTGIAQFYNAASTFSTQIVAGVNTANWTLMLPTTAGVANQVLTTDGFGNTSWVTNGAGTGTVSSVTLDPSTTGLTVNGGTAPVAITTSGTFALGGTLGVANGGTGQATAQAAMNTFAGAVTSGSYLRGDGTNVTMSAIQASDVPVLNQNTTGSAGSATTFTSTTQNSQFNSIGVGAASTGVAGSITASGNINASGTISDGSGILRPKITATPVAVSGTSAVFTGIPSWATRVTMMLHSVQMTGGSSKFIQLGTSGGIVTAGYLGFSTQFSGGPIQFSNAVAFYSILSTDTLQGSVYFDLLDPTNNIWTCTGTLTDSNAAYLFVLSGSVGLPSNLTQIRFTSQSGTETFTGGSINISYE